MSNKKWIWLPYAIGCLALVIGTFYDYTITDFLYKKMPYFGIFFEKIALFPLIVMVSFPLRYLHVFIEINYGK